MTEKDRRGTLVGLQASAYPNTKVAASTFALIEKLTADIPDELLKNAILLHISRSAYFPRPSELRAAAYEIRANELEAPDAYSAWQEVQKAIADHGRWRLPKFSHARIGKAVETLGWTNICNSESPIAERSRFIQAYETLQERDKSSAVVLPGIVRLARRLSAGTAKLEGKRGRD